MDDGGRKKARRPSIVPLPGTKDRCRSNRGGALRVTSHVDPGYPSVLGPVPLKGKCKELRTVPGRSSFMRSTSCLLGFRGLVKPLNPTWNKYLVAKDYGSFRSPLSLLLKQYLRWLSLKKSHKPSKTWIQKLSLISMKMEYMPLLCLRSLILITGPIC